ncbi:MAG: hypothetical protein GXY03_02580 [Solirubrobacterales bacterium]|nr:hypothetical protein [Solirubrobacterales bacterium]
MGTLDRDDIERIARRVAELVAARPPAAARYVDAAEVARVLGVERDWVYAHARQLGAVRLGGPQGRLRFDLQQITRDLANTTNPPPTRRAGRRSAGTGDLRAAELTSPSRHANRHDPPGGPHRR